MQFLENLAMDSSAINKQNVTLSHYITSQFKIELEIDFQYLLFILKLFLKVWEYSGIVELVNHTVKVMLLHIKLFSVNNQNLNSK